MEDFLVVTGGTVVGTVPVDPSVVVEAACVTDGDKILVVTPFDGVPLVAEGLTVEFVGAARRTIPCCSKKYFSVLSSKSSMSSDISKKQKYRMIYRLPFTLDPHIEVCYPCLGLRLRSL